MRYPQELSDAQNIILAVFFSTDEQGYFTAILTDDEYEMLKSGKSSMHIMYDPPHDDSSIQQIGKFPVEFLSEAKDKSDVFTIALPK